MLNSKLDLKTLKAVKEVLELLYLHGNNEDVYDLGEDVINFHINIFLKKGQKYLNYFKNTPYSGKELLELENHHVNLGDGTTPKVTNVYKYQNKYLIKFDNREELLSYSEAGYPDKGILANRIFGINDCVSHKPSTVHDTLVTNFHNTSLANQISDIESGNVIDR